MITPAELAERFSYARFHPQFNLVTWHPTGVLSNERADRMMDFIEMAEDPQEAPFHRYTDMSGYSQIQIGFDHVVRLARRRRSYQGPPVKSALFAVRLISVSIARMYEELMIESPIQVCTFRDRAAAADWLGVSVDLLSAPNCEK